MLVTLVTKQSCSEKEHFQHLTHKLYASNDVEVKKMQGEREKKRRWRRSSGKVDQRRRWSVERRRYLKKIKRSSSRLIRT